jgi:hypothetical protein
MTVSDSIIHRRVPKTAPWLPRTSLRTGHFRIFPVLRTFQRRGGLFHLGFSEGYAKFPVRRGTGNFLRRTGNSSCLTRKFCEMIIYGPLECTEDCADFLYTPWILIHYRIVRYLVNRRLISVQFGIRPHERLRHTFKQYRLRSGASLLTLSDVLPANPEGQFHQCQRSQRQCVTHSRQSLFVESVEMPFQRIRQRARRVRHDGDHVGGEIACVRHDQMVEQSRCAIGRRAVVRPGASRAAAPSADRGGASAGSLTSLPSRLARPASDFTQSDSPASFG